MKDLILIIILIFIFIIIFSSKGKNILYHPIQPQTIYDIELSSYAEEQKSFSVEYSKSDLPTYNVFSELYLPDKFVANVVKTKSQADYILLTSDMLEKKFVFIPPQKVKNITTQTEQNKTERNLTRQGKATNKSEIQTCPSLPVEHTGRVVDINTELTYRDIKDYVQKNLKTYFYPTLSSGKDVIVSVISYTPYIEKQGIVKFKIVNNQKSFFFLNTVEIQTKQGEKLPIKVFSEQFIEPNGEIEGFALFPTYLSDRLTGDKQGIQGGFIEKNYFFIVSDGKNIYKLYFRIP